MQRLPQWCRRASFVDALWLAFALANLAAMWVLIHGSAPNGIETVPFHFIYVSFTILYGFRTWRTRGVVAGITFVALSTGAMTLGAIRAGREEWPELTEVPLMTLMFLAMVFHVRTRQRAVAIADHLAAELQTSLDRHHDFVSDASHELMTPITIAKGHLDLLGRRSGWSQQETEETRAIVDAELDRMQRVIDRLLLLESVSVSGGLLPRPADVDALVGEEFHRWQPTADRDWGLDARSAATAALDRDRITVALDALLENAVRHTRPGDRIHLTARRLGGHVVIEVLDGGDGIPAEALGRIFDRFYRVQPSRDRRTGGAGLGLSVVRAVAEAHGGTASVQSAPGRGSCFSLSLPCLGAAGEQPVAAAPHRLDQNPRLELSP